MKKIVITILSVFMVLSLAACSDNTNLSGETQPSPVPSTSTPKPTDENTPVESTSDTDTGEDNQVQDNDEQVSNILIAYFTMPEADGVDAVSRASRVVVDGAVLGNTQFIAQVIQGAAGGDLFAIETVQKYPVRPDLMDLAANEKSQNARPELSTQIDNLEDYDVIFLGYPNWNADLPMPLYTFLEEYDFSEKTIIPFCPHGGSGFSNTIRTIANLQPNATVITDGFSVSRDGVSGAENDIKNWVQGLDLGN